MCRPIRYQPRPPWLQRAHHALLLRSRRHASVAVLAALSFAGHAESLKVGPQHALRLPSQAAAIAKDGDVVELEGIDYSGDVAIWRANKLILRGVNGMAQLRSNGATANGKAIWVIKGNDTLIENVGFYDARSSARNGAGIRQEGANLTVRNSLFRHNENGILAGAHAQSEIVIENSVFDSNGFGDGKSHNLYVGAIRSLVVRDNHIHGAHVGHQIKSRAAETQIINNRIEDGPDGDSSYLIDLPAGGKALIKGNQLQQGELAKNSTMISYGAEKILHAENSLIVENNRLLNHRNGGCLLLNVHKGLMESARFRGNTLSGCQNMQGLIQAVDNHDLAQTGP